MEKKQILCAVLMTLVSLTAAAACKKTVKPGEACDKEGQTFCKDKKTGLVCAEGKFEEMPCRVGAGCSQVGIGEGNCNNNQFEVGEPCFDPGEYKCTVDGKAMLICEAKRYKMVQKCLGQNGCVANAKGAKCDMSIGAVDDPCAESSKDTYACTEDGKMMLRCDGKKMLAHANCPGMHGCRKQFKIIECNGKQLIK